MSSSQPPAPDWQIWAREQLGVPLYASADESQAIVFAKLEEADFALPEQLRAAVRFGLAYAKVEDPPQRCMKVFHKARLHTLRNAVEDFARQYWSIPAAQREEVYVELSERASNAPLLQLRLDGLMGGLNLEAVVPNEDEVLCLAAKVQELYVLPPTDRAVRRGELVQSLRSQPNGKTVLKLFQRRYPAIARLEPKLKRGALVPSRRWRLRRRLRFEKLVVAIERAPHSGSRVAGIIVSVLLITAFILFLAVASSTTESPTPRPAPTPIKGLDLFQNLHLEVRTKPDGTKMVEAVNKEGKVVPVGEATKRLMGSEELLKREMRLKQKRQEAEQVSPSKPPQPDHS